MESQPDVWPGPVGRPARAHWWSAQPPPPAPPITARRAYAEVLLVFAAFFAASIVAGGETLARRYPRPSGSWALFTPAMISELSICVLAVLVTVLLSGRRGINPSWLGFSWPRRRDGRQGTAQSLRIGVWAIAALLAGGTITRALAMGNKLGQPAHQDTSYLVYSLTASLAAGHCRRDSRAGVRGHHSAPGPPPDGRDLAGRRAAAVLVSRLLRHRRDRDRVVGGHFRLAVPAHGQRAAADRRARALGRQHLPRPALARGAGRHRDGLDHAGAGRRAHLARRRQDQAHAPAACGFGTTARSLVRSTHRRTGRRVTHPEGPAPDQGPCPDKDDRCDHARRVPWLARWR